MCCRCVSGGCLSPSDHQGNEQHQGTCCARHNQDGTPMEPLFFSFLRRRQQAEARTRHRQNNHDDNERDQCEEIRRPHQRQHARDHGALMPRSLLHFHCVVFLVRVQWRRDMGGMNNALAAYSLRRGVLCHLRSRRHGAHAEHCIFGDSRQSCTTAAAGSFLTSWRAAVLLQSFAKLCQARRGIDLRMGCCGILRKRGHDVVLCCLR